jgi:hypothetical protein
MLWAEYLCPTLPSIATWNIMPNVMASGSEWVCILQERDSYPYKRDPRAFPWPGKDTEKMVTYEWGRRLSSRHQVLLDFPDTRNVRNRSLLFKICRLWYLVIAIWADSRQAMNPNYLVYLQNFNTPSEQTNNRKEMNE